MFTLSSDLPYGNRKCWHRLGGCRRPTENLCKVQSGGHRILHALVMVWNWELQKTKNWNKLNPQKNNRKIYRNVNSFLHNAASSGSISSENFAGSALAVAGKPVLKEVLFQQGLQSPSIWKSPKPKRLNFKLWQSMVALNRSSLGMKASRSSATSCPFQSRKAPVPDMYRDQLYLKVRNLSGQKSSVPIPWTQWFPTIEEKLRFLRPDVLLNQIHTCISPVPATNSKLGNLPFAWTWPMDK